MSLFILFSEMRMVFTNIRMEVMKKFNDIERHTSVSGFIFLRFFCPAILNPKMFGIIEGSLLFFLFSSFLVQTQDFFFFSSQSTQMAWQRGA